MRSARMAEGSWLLAIMRSSVFRSRAASPYRYVSSAPTPRPTPTDHFASLEDQMASPIRVIPNILFLFRNQISRPTATGKRAPELYDSLCRFSPFFRCSPKNRSAEIASLMSTMMASERCPPPFNDFFLQIKVKDATRGGILPFSILPSYGKSDYILYITLNLAKVKVKICTWKEIVYNTCYRIRNYLL